MDEDLRVQNVKLKRKIRQGLIFVIITIFVALYDYCM